MHWYIPATSVPVDIIYLFFSFHPDKLWNNMTKLLFKWMSSVWSVPKVCEKYYLLSSPQLYLRKDNIPHVCGGSMFVFLNVCVYLFLCLGTWDSLIALSTKLQGYFFLWFSVLELQTHAISAPLPPSFYMGSEFCSLCLCSKHSMDWNISLAIIFFTESWICHTSYFNEWEML